MVYRTCNKNKSFKYGNENSNWCLRNEFAQKLRNQIIKRYWYDLMALALDGPMNEARRHAVT